MKVNLHFKGSATSGNHGHAGRPGERGGSAPSGEGGSSHSTSDKKPKQSQARQELSLLRERLAAGHLKRGERALLEKRMEEISKKVMDEEQGPAPSSESAPSKPVTTPTKVTRPVRTRELADVVSVEGIQKGIPKSVLDVLPVYLHIMKDNPDTFTFAKGFYYRSGTPEGFAVHVMDQLEKAGYKVDAPLHGEHYYPGFVGGATTFSPRNSFYYVVLKVTRK